MRVSPLRLPQLFSETVLLLLIAWKGPTKLYNLCSCHIGLFPQDIPQSFVGSNLNLSQGRNFTISLGILFSRPKGYIRKPFPSAACRLSLPLVHEFCSALMKLPVSSCPRLPWLRSLSQVFLTVSQMPFIEETSWST